MRCLPRFVERRSTLEKRCVQRFRQGPRIEDINRDSGLCFVDGRSEEIMLNIAVREETSDLPQSEGGALVKAAMVLYGDPSMFITPLSHLACRDQFFQLLTFSPEPVQIISCLWFSLQLQKQVHQSSSIIFQILYRGAALFGQQQPQPNRRS